MNKKIINALITWAIPLVIWFTPAPEGLADGAWKLFGFYLAAIVGLVLKPFPAPVAVLSAIGASALFLNNPKEVLSGYASTTTWLIFAAFSISVAFVKTGLGRRIAYHMIDAFGHTTLRLGYVTALLDGIISPATPSNTARCGGIVFPIMNSVAKSLGSEPGETANKVGRYLMTNTYMVTKVTSLLFLTAMAPNALAADYFKKILGLSIDWVTWAVALFVPGLLLLLITPLVSYMLNKPELKEIDNKKIAREGLAELGPVSTGEKVLIAIFFLSLLGWALPSILAMVGIKFKLDATAVALVAMVSCYMFGAIKWEDALQNKGGWNTLIWFGGILGLSGALTKADFFIWLAKVLEAQMNFGHHEMVALVVIAVLSVAVRYLFASGSAYIAAMVPVFFTVGKVAGIDPWTLGLVIFMTNAFGGAVTHFGGGPGPIIFGEGYNEVRQWWVTGAVIAVLGLVVTLGFGPIWWSIVGLI